MSTEAAQTRLANLKLVSGHYPVEGTFSNDLGGRIAGAVQSGDPRRYLAISQRDAVDDGPWDTAAALCATVPEALEKLSVVANDEGCDPVGVFDLDTAEMQDVRLIVELSPNTPYQLT